MSESMSNQSKSEKKRRYEFHGPTGLVISGPNCSSSGSGAQRGTSFSNGGTVLSQAQLQLVFWGGWSFFGIGIVAAQIQTMVTGLYMTPLNQYGVGHAQLRNNVGAFNDSLPNPFTFDDVGKFLIRHINEGRLPEPDDVPQLVYCVIMPSDATFTDPNVIGQNGSVIWSEGWTFPVDWPTTQSAHFMWVGGSATSIEAITTIFSHELVEICTDPNGDKSGVIANSGTPGCPPTGPCQIGDVCTGVCDRVDGVMVQAYWSQQDGACVLPQIIKH